jgi:hypothetical protein
MRSRFRSVRIASGAMQFTRSFVDLLDRAGWDGAAAGVRPQKVDRPELRLDPASHRLDRVEAGDIGGHPDCLSALVHRLSVAIELYLSEHKYSAIRVKRHAAMPRTGGLWSVQI